ncbi:MAG: hypothetical protein A2X48_16635 [Lentisphaerae bacterium GWF2_49_21]|nr:MAG: hypothetical protein A2X48_16635 [Lentisphaerae bacterium GWF2_49_21]
MRFSTGYTGIFPDATAASAAFCTGTSSESISLRFLAWTAMGSNPFTGLTLPFKASSPTIMVLESFSRSSFPVVAIMLNAMGRSNAAPSFRMSAGASPTTVFPNGCVYPQLSSADLTRSRLSLIAASGSPTTDTVVFSPCPVAFTSTSTVYASTPFIAAEKVLASISHPILCIHEKIESTI